MEGRTGRVHQVSAGEGAGSGGVGHAPLVGAGLCGGPAAVAGAVRGLGLSPLLEKLPRPSRLEVCRQGPLRQPRLPHPPPRFPLLKVHLCS